MKRYAPLLLLLLTGETTPGIDANKGIELINLAPSDARAALGALFGLLVIQTIERWWSGWRGDKMSARFTEGIERLTSAINTLGGAHAITTLQLESKIGEQVTRISEQVSEARAQTNEIRTQASEIRTLTDEVRRLKL